MLSQEKEWCQIWGSLAWHLYLMDLIKKKWGGKGIINRQNERE